ncbi:putative heterokaryon incompatibility [Septoria linicola]|nr:putative heterokaryon incompatibility [Septoria linicola]
MEQSANHHIADRIYSNLDVSKKQHRLIRFVGGGRDLAWELGTFSCTRPQPLTALSYCWGKAHADRQITLNGHIFLVRPNLHGFLDDIPERSVQVTYMGQIYRNAEEVIAWMYFEDTEDPRIMKQADVQRYIKE